MLDQHQRRWTNSDSTSGQSFVLAEIVVFGDNNISYIIYIIYIQNENFHETGLQIRGNSL